MPRKVLQIVETAYRATLEEQDDTVVWIAHAMRGAGADLALLLKGHAVNYAVKGQDASGLSIGGKAQTQPPRLDDDLAKLVAKGVQVFMLEDDARERGIGREDIMAEVRLVSRAGLPQLFAEYDQIWHW